MAKAKPARKAPAPKAEPKTAPVKDAGPERGSSVVIRRRTFVQRVLAEAGGPRSDARKVIEATLQVLGEALAADEQLVLPPLGKARVARHRSAGGSEVLIVRLRRPDPPAENAPEALAEPDEDS